MHRKDIAPGEIAWYQRLARTLSWWHLVALGVGAIVGTGIYTLIGVGANLRARRAAFIRRRGCDLRVRGACVC
jgi:hypothetical protein